MFRWWRANLIRDPARRGFALAELGKDYLRRGNLSLAFQAFNNGWRAVGDIPDPENQVRWLAAYHATHAGWVCGLKEDYSNANLWCKIALARMPDFPKAHELRARLLVANGDVEEAEKEIEVALTLNASAEEPDPGIVSGISVLREQLRERMESDGQGLG